MPDYFDLDYLDWFNKLCKERVREHSINVFEMCPRTSIEGSKYCLEHTIEHFQIADY